MTPHQRLILFDIDGTLLWPNGAGRKAMRQALAQVVGRTGPIDHHPMAGKTDPQIATELLQAAGLSPEEAQAHVPAVLEAMASILPETLAASNVRPCPGVPGLLAALEDRPQALLGLLTGNLARTAPLKLTAAGLKPETFRVGAFGSDHADRSQLPGIATSRAEALTGRPYTGPEIVIVGDTPADVACTRPWQARAIAVATGPYSEADLEAAGADVVFADLTNLQAILEAIL